MGVFRAFLLVGLAGALRAAPIFSAGLRAAPGPRATTWRPTGRFGSSLGSGAMGGAFSATATVRTGRAATGNVGRTVAAAVATGTLARAVATMRVPGPSTRRTCMKRRS